jgi:hypothetical protein
MPSSFIPVLATLPLACSGAARHAPRSGVPCDPQFDIQTGLILVWSDQ